MLWAYSGTQVAIVVKNLPVNAGDKRDTGSIPESGSSPGEETGDPFEYSYMENPIDRVVWQVIVERVTKSQT